jgi:uncharacterized protein (DUF697 family)
MGTSQSSKGAPGNVPIVPPWVPPLPAPAPAPSPAPDADDQQDNAPTQPPVTPPAPSAPRAMIAPAGRFSSARRAASAFANTGAASQLKRSLGHYVRKGYSGARATTSRFGGTVGTADALYGALTPGQRAEGAGGQLDRTLLVGRSADQIMDAVVEAVRPVDGTLDGDASRLAIKDALSELLVKYPEADLLNLSDEQRLFTIERFVAVDVFQRFALDLGKIIQDKASSARVALRRLKDVKDYILQAVSAAFRKLRTSAQTVTAGGVKHVVQAALLETFQVFENYTE